MFERRLDNDEVLLEIRESVRQHGQLSAFKFMFKHCRPVRPLGESGMLFHACPPNQSCISHSFHFVGFLVFVAPEARGGDADSSGSDEEFFSLSQKQQIDQCDRMGYLQKCGAKDQNWLDRWFILQGQKLYYYKTHEHTKPITYIPLGIRS